MVALPGSSLDEKISLSGWIGALKKRFTKIKAKGMNLFNGWMLMNGSVGSFGL
jgi:hypothetical protein